MEPLRARQWLDFAKAMCFGAWPEITEARKNRLWQESESFIDDYKNEPVDGWDNDYCLCDAFADRFEGYESTIYHQGRNGSWYDDNPRYFANQLRCVIRASIDAVCGGFGVLGFTVGDVRRMFGGEIPGWVLSQYEDLTDATPDYLTIAL